jgi:hypothetical protein
VARIEGSHARRAAKGDAAAAVAQLYTEQAAALIHNAWDNVIYHVFLRKTDANHDRH